MSGRLPSGTVALLFSDVEGSTQLLRALGDAYPSVLSELERLLRASFAEYGGEVVDTQGDSFFVAFRTVGQAVGAAVSAQRALAAQEWVDGCVVRVRMGIHAGEPRVSEERYVGLGVHRAARICAVAHGGQVLLSEAAAALLAETEQDGVTVHDLGARPLKDFDRPERLFQLVVADLPASFPPPRAEAVGGQPSGQLRVRVLGPLEVERASGLVDLGGNRQRALLAALILRAGQVVPSDQLIEQLWGSSPPKTAMTSLQNGISALRKVLGADVVVTRSPGYVLAIDREAIDVFRFERMLSESRGAEPGARRELLLGALGLWRGQPFADFTFAEFAQSEIRRLEELHVTAIEQRIEADIDLGRAADVIGELESLTVEHPLREGPVRLQMLALYHAGRQAEALQAYQRLRTTLDDELGIAPGEPLQDLYRRILRHDVTRADVPATRAGDVEGEIVRAMLAGRVVPVVALVGAQALASDLVATFQLGSSDGPLDLARISQHVAMLNGSGPLYDELHARFQHAVEPGPLHRLLASLPPLLRAHSAPHQLIVSTRYDLALERAFEEAGEELDVVTYVASGPDRGKFWHRSPGGEPRPVDLPNRYATELSLETRTVLLRLHGAVDPDPDRAWESFVVTEDDFIDYLGRGDIGTSVPVSLAARLRRSHFLFLGYEMADWSFRLVLGRIWADRPASYRSWAVQPGASALERAFWRRHDVEVVDAEPEAYAGLLTDRLAVAT